MGRTPLENHRFSAKFYCFGLRNCIFKIFHFGARHFLYQNSISLKLVQLFDWKWINREDSVRGSSFFGQIPSFRPSKWHFFQIFVSEVVFFFTPEFILRQICATFRLEIGQSEGLPWRIIVFQPNSIVLVIKMAFFKNFRFGALFFLCQNSVSLKLVQLFDLKWVNR